MSLVEDIREVEVFEKEESRHTQVSGVGVIEDVPVKIVLGVEARWPVSTSPSSCLHLYQELLLYIYIIADSLFGSYQVRHVDAAVGEPASSHKCERRPQAW